jgi:hypothetical protein
MRGFRKGTQARRDADLICERLAQTPIPEFKPSRFIFGAAIDSAEMATRQYLLQRVLLRLPPHLLAGAPIEAALPEHWRWWMRERGIRVNGGRSSLRWNWRLLQHIGHALVVAGRHLAGMLRRGPTVPFAYFHGINRPAGTYTALNWYLQWSGRKAETVVHTGNPASRTSFLGCLRFVAWFLAAASLSAFDLLRWRWWHPLMLAEATKAAALRYSTGLATDYLFHNSGWVYRPLWSYEAEARGSRLLLYHYSTSSEAWQSFEGDRDPYTWQLGNWPHHLVWDQWQADFVHRVSPASKVEIVGPIWFSDSDDTLELDSRSVAVFDVQPFRNAIFQSVGVVHEYYTPATSAAFLRDIAAACAEAGRTMAWKRKREIGKIAHPAYRRLDIEAEIVPAGVSAFRVIAASSMVISMPFTSTALIGRAMGKPSCYYDPIGAFRPDDRAAHGIPVLYSRSELLAWIKQVSPPI